MSFLLEPEKELNIIVRGNFSDSKENWAKYYFCMLLINR